jgi:hypothetical protein
LAASLTGELNLLFDSGEAGLASFITALSHISGERAAVNGL